MTTTCLVLGGADCLEADLAAYQGDIDGVVACNIGGVVWPGDLDAWVTLHANQWVNNRHNWLLDRASRGYPSPLALYTHQMPDPKFEAEGIKLTDYHFPEIGKSGSSGMFALKVALVDLGFDNAVLCGMPMDERPHALDREKLPWNSYQNFRGIWADMPDAYCERTRSMSGWTKTLLGPPDWS